MKKIWYQHSMGKYKDYELYDNILKKYIDEIAKKDVRVEHYWLPKGMGGELSYASVRKLNEPYIVNAAMRAERKGYDGFAIGCYFDPAFYAVRETVSIPSLSLGISSMILAKLLGGRFAVITSPKKAMARINHQIKIYGFEGLKPIVRGMDFSVSSITEALRKPRPLLESFKFLSEEAVEEGADVIIPGCGIIEAICVKENLRMIKDTPVISSIAATIKLLEVLIDLKTVGLDLSRKLLYKSPPKGVLDAIGKTYESYGVEM